MRRAQGVAQMGGREDAAVAQNRMNGDPGERRRSAALRAHDVRADVHDDAVAGFGVRADRHLVRHGAGGHVDGVVLAQNLGGAGLEPLDRGIVAVHVVADGGLGHRLTHCGGGTGDRVAAEIDHRELSSGAANSMSMTSWRGR